MKGHKLHVLMADDSEDDVYFVQRALSKARAGSSLSSVGDGSGAVDYLSGKGEYANREKFPFPAVLLCDLKMPGLDGYGVLRWMKQHSQCKVIPTVIYSSSALGSDVQRCYELGANAYLQKPPTLEELSEVMVALFHFWSLCKIPEVPSEQKWD